MHVASSGNLIDEGALEQGPVVTRGAHLRPTPPQKEPDRREPRAIVFAPRGWLCAAGMNVLLRFFQPTILPATPRFALPRGAPDRAGSSVGLFRHAAGKAGRRGVRSGSDGPRAGLRSGRDRPLRLPPARACARRAPPRRARAPRDLPRGSPPAR